MRLLEKRMGNASMVKAQPTASGNSGRVCRSSSKVLLFKNFFYFKRSSGKDEILSCRGHLKGLPFWKQGRSPD